MSTATTHPRRPARQPGRRESVPTHASADPLEQLIHAAAGLAEDEDVRTWVEAMRDHGALASSGPRPGGPGKGAAA
jgi:hypothetical protein